MSDVIEDAVEKKNENEAVLSEAESGFEQQRGNEALWKQIFAVGAPDLQKMQRWNKRLPSNPRCKLCNAPFAGVGGVLMRLRGKARNFRNPNFCNACDAFIEANPGGAEIDMSILFVDIRGSTNYAEKSTPMQVSQRVNAFLDRATDIITKHDGFVSAFYGDCVSATWPPGFCGDEHAKKCLAAAKELASQSIKDQNGESIPVGVGAHSGQMYMSVVSAAKGTFRDVSVFGVNVNKAARLASEANASEALVTQEALDAASATPGSEGKQLALKGISDNVTAYTL